MIVLIEIGLPEGPIWQAIYTMKKLNVSRVGFMSKLCHLQNAR